MANLDIDSTLEYSPHFSVVLKQLVVPEIPPPPEPVSAVLVQHTWGHGPQPGHPVSKAFGSNVTAGNTLIVVVMLDASVTDLVAANLTDTLGNTYVRDVISSSSSQQGRLAIFRSSAIAAGGANTVSYEFGSNSFMALHLMEWSGLASNPLSGTGTGFKNFMQLVNNVVETSSFSPSGTSTIIGTTIGINAGTITPGSTYTEIDEYDVNGANGPQFNTESKAVEAGTYTADWTMDGLASGWTCAAAAYLTA
jgi:hypothetical protein